MLQDTTVFSFIINVAVSLSYSPFQKSTRGEQDATGHQTVSKALRAERNGAAATLKSYRYDLFKI